MADKDFVVKNGIVVNTAFSANSSGIFSNNFTSNSTGVYTGVVNGSSFSIGTSTVANSTGVYTGIVNGSSISVGTSTVANSTGVYTGVVNGTSFSIGTTFVANTTGAYHTGTVNAISYTIGSSTIANSTGVYTGVVNGSSFSIGSSFTANSTLVNCYSLSTQTNTVTLGSAVYLDSGGNVSIGQNTAIRRLTVGGAFEAALVGSPNNNPLFYLNVTNTTGNLGSNGSLIIRGLDSNGGNGSNLASIDMRAGSVYMNNDLYFNSGYGSTGKVYGVRSWINFYDNAVRNSGNISGISKQSTGYWIIYHSTSMPDGNYAAVGNYSRRNENTGDQNDGQAMCWDYQSSYFRVTVCKGDGAIIDPSAFCSIVIVR